jgi:two-component system response regulator NreC
MPSSIRVLLVDDHVLVRAGLRALLEETQGFEVVGEARDGIEALEMIVHLRPAVAVMDLIMPGLSGLETTRQIRERHPDTEVVILSMYGDEEQILQALQAGARGYVRKGSDVARLIGAVREAASGRYDYSDVIGAEQLKELLTRPCTLGRYDTLTRREREILHLAAWGYTSAQIASRLGISPRTVETHRAHVLRKLGLRNQVDLVFFAIRHGVLTPDSAEAVRARERLAH